MKYSEFISTLPSRLRCTNALGSELGYCKRGESPGFSTISPNAKNYRRWMIFDLDKSNSWDAAEESRLPSPTFTAVNRVNGHSHMGYLLSEPVSVSMNSGRKPIDFYDSVRRGFTSRLGADPSYTGFLCKNPTHERWEVIWGMQDGFQLTELDDYLTKADKRKLSKKEYVSDLGRNCTTFDTIRHIAYSKCSSFKSRGLGFDDFQNYVLGIAENTNRGFKEPLSRSEIRCIARSVSKWTWTRYGGKASEAASKAGRDSVNRRWSNPEFLKKYRPWLLPKGAPPHIPTI